MARAKQAGELVPTAACQRCGAKPNYWYRDRDTGEIIGTPTGGYYADQDAGGWQLQAHHHRGYSPEHWLDVEWLCPTCHGKADNPPRNRWL